MSQPTVLLESYPTGGGASGSSYAFSGLCGEVFAAAAAEVRSALCRVEEAVAKGLHAAGYIAYEAASGLDPVLATQVASGELPLLWFGLFDTRRRVAPGRRQARLGYRVGAWSPSVTGTQYQAALKAIHDYIGAGDTYQVNYTLRLRASFAGDAFSFYRDLTAAQPTAHCAYLDLGRFAVLSASPELFFALENGRLRGRPMKGTRERGRGAVEDAKQARELRESAKERAENLMILDLMRNDFGRVSVVGTVEVPALWQVESYPSLWQMTSQVESRLQPGTSLTDLLAALFPCGSVTGAPKVRTMQIIGELERGPRGIYTGCIGYVSPGPEARFSVAIRTAVIDRSSSEAEYGVGGGITWDSRPQAEFDEVVAKARILPRSEAECEWASGPGNGTFDRG